jgi:hypothetical protein
MGDSFFEVVKTVGGLSGISSAVFLIYDRFTKHYPVAFIEARPLIEGSQNIVPFLFLKNVSERPILLSWTDGDAAKLRIGRDQSSRGIMRTLFDGETTIALSPQGEAVLPMFRPQAYEVIDPENMMELDLRWQFAQPVLWRAPRKLRIKIRKRDLDDMIDGYIEPSNGSGK